MPSSKTPRPITSWPLPIRAAEILGMLLDDEDVPRFGEHRDELAGLLPLLGVDRFDRRTLNRALAAHAAAETRAA